MRTRRLVAHLGAAAVLSVPAVGLGNQLSAPRSVRAAAGGSITVDYSIDAATFDPAESINPPDNGITTGALFSGLYRINVKGKLIPDIAAGFPQVSADQKVFTVHLKHGVEFNGVDFTARELTAADVVYTINRTLNPKLKPQASPFAGDDMAIQGAAAYAGGKAASVSGVQALDKYTVRFTLARSLSSFPYALAYTGNFIVPKEAVAKYGADFGSHPVGTGPFMLKQWVKGQKAILVRNPLYFVKGLPYLDGITFEFNVGKSLEVLRWKSGQIDAIGDSSDLSPETAFELSNDPAFKQYVEPTQPSGTTNVLYINNLIPPFNNKLVRQAVAYAIDKKQLVKRYRGQATVSTQIYPPAVLQHDPGFQDYGYNPAKAAALLKAAGYNGTPVEVLVDEGASNDPVEEPVVVQDLRAAGFKVKVKGVSDSVAGNLIFTNKGYTIIFGYWGMDYPDAFDFVDPTYTADGFNGGLNFSRYQNPKVDTLTAQAEALPFGAARNAVYARIQRILVDDVAAVPLFYRLRFNLDGPHVASLGWTPAYSFNEWAYAQRR
ncbi:MAG TPA: ABC transporter substrate-binding protein [Chloroflexota bacterium]